MGKTLRQVQGKTYAELCAEFPLRPIRSEKEYERAVRLAGKLTDEDSKGKTSDDADYLEMLTLLIALYEERFREYVGSAVESDVHMLCLLLGSPEMTAVSLEEWLWNSTPMSRDRARAVSRKLEAFTRGEITELAKMFRVSQMVFVVGHRRQR